MKSLERKKSKPVKQPIHYDADRQTDVFDFYETEEPYKEIQIT